MDLFVFSTNEATVRAVSVGGAAGILVDWERSGKQQRQHGFDTEINTHDEKDLANVRAWTDGRVICRIDRNHDWRLQKHQIDQVIDLGGDEILLPMVRSMAEPTRVLDYVTNRSAIGVGILVETQAAVSINTELAQLPLSRVYVGLNDLAIDRGSDFLFEPLKTGYLADIMAPFSVPVGFGGLTLPDLGHPVPCRSLMAALLDMDCSFTFLRRSFFTDTQNLDRANAVQAIVRELDQMCALDAAELHRTLISSLHQGYAGVNLRTGYSERS